MRYMADPAVTGTDYDFYPERYKNDTDDQGGVHSNSGIANLAFVLMVQGGKHPRSKTSVTVPPINATDFKDSLLKAAKIFYLANTACLTPMSGFYRARECTILHAGNYKASVEAAWDAVGVTASLKPSILPVGTSVLLSATQGTTLPYILENVVPGAVVSCRTSGSNGDADLHMAMRSQSSQALSQNVSESDTSNEAGFVGPMSKASTVYVNVYAYSAFTDLTLRCTSFVLLTNEVTSAALTAPANKAVTLSLMDIPRLSRVTCRVGATSGLPSVVVKLFSFGGGNIQSVDSCSVSSSQYSANKAVCKMNSGELPVFMEMNLQAGSTGFSGLTVTCSSESMLTTIANWNMHTETNAGLGSDPATDLVRYYGLSTSIQTTDYLMCQAKRNVSATIFMDVYMKPLGAFSASDLPACSTSATANYVSCTPKPPSAVTSGAYMKVVQRSSPLNVEASLQVMCGLVPAATALPLNGLSLTGLSGVQGSGTALRMYRMGGVLAGEKVSCAIEGSNGNADLYVRVGRTALPLLSGSNSCQDTGTTSRGTCLTPALSTASYVSVAVHAKTSYTGLLVVCKRDASTCKVLGGTCTSASQCCGALSTCDGSKCIAGVAPGGACLRSTQCRRGYLCTGGVCKV